MVLKNVAKWLQEPAFGRKKQSKEDLKLKSQKKSDDQARRKGMEAAVAGKNPGKRSRIIGRAEARSYLPDDLRKKPKYQWTGRDKKRAREAQLKGMHKDTQKVNKKIKSNKKAASEGKLTREQKDSVKYPTRGTFRGI